MDNVLAVARVSCPRAPPPSTIQHGHAHQPARVSTPPCCDSCSPRHRHCAPVVTCEGKPDSKPKILPDRGQHPIVEVTYEGLTRRHIPEHRKFSTQFRSFQQADFLIQTHFRDECNHLSGNPKSLQERHLFVALVNGEMNEVFLNTSTILKLKSTNLEQAEMERRR
ncbi:unnamed protein product [Calypogeia fissa]